MSPVLSKMLHHVLAGDKLVPHCPAGLVWFPLSSLELNHDNVPTWINLANVLTAQKSRDKKLEALQIYKTYKDQTPAFYNLDSVIAGLQTELGVK